MKVNLLHSESDNGGGNIVDSVEGREAAHEPTEVLRRTRCDTTCDSSMHAQEGDDIHLISNHVDIDLDVSRKVCEMAEVLLTLVKRRP